MDSDKHSALVERLEVDTGRPEIAPSIPRTISVVYVQLRISPGEHPTFLQDRAKDLQRSQGQG